MISSEFSDMLGDKRLDLFRPDQIHSYAFRRLWKRQQRALVCHGHSVGRHYNHDAKARKKQAILLQKVGGTPDFVIEPFSSMVLAAFARFWKFVCPFW